VPLQAPASIDSPRLQIRLVTRADLQDLMAVNGDEAVTRFLPYATWSAIADAHAWYERMEKIQATGTALQFVLIERGAPSAPACCSASTPPVRAPNSATCSAARNGARDSCTRRWPR